MKNLILLLLVALVFTFNSCKKDKDEVVTPKTKTQLLCGKNWKITAATVDPAIDWNGSGAVSANLYNQLQTCEKDGINVYNSNGTYTSDEGASKCDVSDPQTVTGTWVFNTNETIITLITLNETTLVLSYSEVINSVNYTVTATFTKQ